MTASPRLPRLAVVGSVNIDITHHVDALPTPGETVLANTRELHLGGKGANQAATAARLGAQTTLLAAVGDDEHARFARTQLERAGVNIDHLCTTARPTGTAAIAVDPEGENLIIVDPSANAELGPLASLGGGDTLLLQLEVPLEAVTAAVEAATGFVALNLAPARHLPAATLERADLIIVNEHEWRALPELAGCRRVVVTSGSEGIDLIEHGAVALHVDAVPTEVVNTVGAGDAFSAAVTLGFAAGLDPRTALSVAAAVGAEAVADPASQPHFARYQDYLDRA